VLVAADMDNEGIILAGRIEPARPGLGAVLEDPDGAY